MRPLDRRAQQVWRAFGGWIVTDVLTTGRVSDSVIYGGSSCFRVAGEELAHEYDRRALYVTPTGDWCGAARRKGKGEHDETYPWRDLIAHAETLPTDLLDRLRDAQRKSQRHAQVTTSWPCGDTGPQVGPPTEAQQQLRDRRDRHERDVWRPWVKAKRLIDAERAALLDEAFPLAVDTEPTDLLELLAVTA